MSQTKKRKKAEPSGKPVSNLSMRKALVQGKPETKTTCDQMRRCKTCERVSEAEHTRQMEEFGKQNEALAKVCYDQQVDITKLQNRLEAINKHYAEILREYAKLDEKIAKLDEETFDHLGPESVNLGVALDWLGVLLVEPKSEGKK